MENAKQTLVVNFFGGPGAGKSTAAAWLFARLKMDGIDCEYVTEFAKDKVWENNREAFKNQFYITGKQSFRISRCNGKVDVIVTDSPIVLGAVYDQENPYFGLTAAYDFKKYNNLSIMLMRAHEYDPNGRNQTELEAKAIDNLIADLLDKYEIPYITETADKQGYENIYNVVISRLTEKQTNKYMI